MLGDEVGKEYAGFGGGGLVLLMLAKGRNVTAGVNGYV